MKKHSIIWTVLLSILVSFAISKWGLTESSEARYAQISKEMYVRCDYLHPTLLRIYHFHKPPVTYYITALGYAIFGLNETGARFFLMVALLVQLSLVYKITKTFYHNSDIAMIAMLIYFSYPIVQAAAKNLTTDAFLTSFIFGAIYYFICYKQKQKIIYLYLFYLLCGLAFLTKGPVGIMPQGLFAIWYHRKYPAQKSLRFHHYVAFLLGLIICFSWFILLVADNPALFTYFIKHQLVDRVASDTFSRTQPWWYYLLTMPLLGLPAFLYFADYLRAGVSFTKKNRRSNACILISSLGIAFIVFSLSSSKLVLYVLPLYLFIAMLSASHLFNMPEKNRNTVVRIMFFYSCVFLSAIIISCFLKLPVEIPAVPALVLATAGIGATIMIYYNKRMPVFIKAPLLNAYLMMVLILLIPFVMNRNELKINSVKPIAVFINHHSVSNKKAVVAVYDYLLPSLAFYTNKKIITIDNGNTSTKREVQFEGADKKWEEGYVKIGDPGSGSRISSLLKANDFFLVTRENNDLPDSMSYLKSKLLHKKKFDKWVVYY